MSFILLAIGFALLIKSADLLIDSASKLAKLFAIPSFIVGFSVIAFGTSAPELVIGIFSGVNQTNLITLGDVIGSNIANIALIIGISAIISPLPIGKSVLHKEIPLSFLVQSLALIMLAIGGVMSRLDAMILILFFVTFLFYIFNRSKDSGFVEIEDTTIVKEESESVTDGKVKLTIILFVSIIGVIIGGNLVVTSSTSIAHMFGLSDVLIGLTIVAIGTSLPELVTSVMAALKNQSDIAVGNIIGSNIFNILLVLGVSSLISPIPKTNGVYVDILTMLFTTLLAFVLSQRRKMISKFGGIILLSFYIVYIMYKILSV